MKQLKLEPVVKKLTKRLKHAVQAVRDLRSELIKMTCARLAADSRLRLSEDRLNQIMSQAQALASNQVEQFCAAVRSRQRLPRKWISARSNLNKGCLHIWPNYTSQAHVLYSNSFMSEELQVTVLSPNPVVRLPSLTPASQGLSVALV